MLNLYCRFIEIFEIYHCIVQQKSIDELENELERRKKHCIERAEEVFRYSAHFTQCN